MEFLSSFLWGKGLFYELVRISCGCSKDPVNETSLGGHHLCSAPKGEEKTFVP